MTAIEAYGHRPPRGPERPVLVSIPHTGTFVPADIVAALASDRMRALPMTDWHLHQLYDFLPELGVETIYATYSRFVVDLNRPPDSRPLYPGRFETGLVPVRSFEGEPIWRSPPGSDEVERRCRLYHAPYHARLTELLEAQRRRFGRAWLIDAHSIASRASLLHPELTEDVYLGNRDGASCEPWLLDVLAQSFERRGLRVARNAPYKGGYITDHYGRLDGVDAVQIEICQRLYMDEARPSGAEGGERFDLARRMLRRVFEELLVELDRRLGPTSP